MTEHNSLPTVRNASTDDAPIIARFNCAMALETENHTLDPGVVNAGVRTAIEQPAHGFYLVAEHDEQVAGCLLVTYEWSDWRNSRIWWIQSVYVDPGFRGRGLYKALYRAVVERAQAEEDINTIRLYVEKDNRLAQSVYEKLGMHNSGYLVYEATLKD